jgi:hypothetical protein
MTLRRENRIRQLAYLTLNSMTEKEKLEIDP